jgi:hypothetical protein
MFEVAFPLPLSYLQPRPAFALFLPLDVLDAAGRPLMEGRTVLHTALKAQLVRCPYADHRADSGKPMNATALHDFSQRGIESLHLFSRYCSMVAATHSSAESSVLGLWQVAKVGTTIATFELVPSMLGYHEGRQLGVVTSGVYKVCRGLADLAELLLADIKDPHMRCDVNDVMTFVHRHKLLVGRNETCAAPEGLIRRVLQLITDALTGTTEKSPLTESERAHLTFAALYSQMERLCFVYELTRCAIVGDKGPGHATSRHTFSKARDALAIAGKGRVARLKAVEDLERLMWANVDPVGEAALRATINLSRAILNSCPHHARQDEWRVFAESIACAMQRINLTLGKMFNAGSNPQAVISVKDIQNFFGHAPTFLQ